MKVLLDTPRCALFHGSCFALALPDVSVDAIVTDPPYLLTNANGTGFMGREWDSLVVGPEGAGRASEAWHKQWTVEALRVLKPGGHLLAFGGSRTAHRLACAIEDVGFELRDVLFWAYGSGFPKSLDVSKQDAIAARPDLTERWRGWGTALKPAYEPIVLARKPLDSTVVASVLAHGTGALNIDGCRIGDEVRFNQPSGGAPDDGAVYGLGMRGRGEGTTAVGRWPANLLLSHHDECVATGTVEDAHEVRVGPRLGDDSRGLAFGMGAQATTTTRVAYACHEDCPARMLDEQAGERVSGSRKAGVRASRVGFTRADQPADGGPEVVGLRGGASRFFYCAKPARREKDAGLDHLPKRSGGEVTDRQDGSDGLKSPRAGAGRNGGVHNSHATVKPIELMRYLCRLVCPPGGVVLDPFGGSGTTGVAALAEGFNFVGVELGGDDNEHLPIILGRLRHALALPQYHPAVDPALVDVDGWWRHEAAPAPTVPAFDLSFLRNG